MTTQQRARVDHYVAAGWQPTGGDAIGVYLRMPKHFNWLAFISLSLLGGIPAVIYIIVYATRRERRVAIDPKGRVIGDVSHEPQGTDPDDIGAAVLIFAIVALVLMLGAAIVSGGQP